VRGVWLDSRARLPLEASWTRSIRVRLIPFELALLALSGGRSSDSSERLDPVVHVRFPEVAIA